jgi:hypothetical protein
MDIQYLKTEGERFSSIIYVDSAKRNRVFFPDPQKYEVVFNEPFRNVFSVQVLDASIPRTHYNVDPYNNVLCYNVNDIDFVVTLDIGDYTDVELVEAINAQLVGITVDFLSSPSDRRKQFVFLSENPFCIKPFKTTMRELIGLDQGFQSEINSVDDPANYQVSLVNDTLGNAGVRATVDSADVVFYQRFSVSESGKVGTLEFNMYKNDTDLLQTNDFDLRVRVIRLSNQTTVAEAQVHSSAFTDRVVLSDWIHSNQFLAGQEYVFVISTVNANYVHYDLSVDIVSNDTQQLYVQQDVSLDFDLNAFLNGQENTVNKYGSPQTVEDVYFGITTDTVGVNMGLNFRLTTLRELHSLVPPGIYNLLGDRYIILRCKEIENHIMSSIKSFNAVNPETNSLEERQYDTGIAKFKMSVVGFREERFDFNTLPPQEFHPIGKLTSLTFSFENQDGREYDFKGVNHTITLAINHYKPINKLFQRPTKN